MAKQLIIKDLKHSYDEGQQNVQVLSGVNATFDPGKMYAIVGESGSGKTTLISLIAALDQIQSGDIEYDGQSVKDIGESQFRLQYVSIVFQSFNLIRYMTARENVEVALDFDGHGKDSKEKAYEALERVGLNREKADRLVGKLSGGEQQRVAIARCIAGETPIVVADEPTGNLDENTEEKILALFKAMADDGKIVIIVTHSQKVARHADAIVYRMRSGMLSK